MGVFIGQKKSFICSAMDVFLKIKIKPYFLGLVWVISNFFFKLAQINKYIQSAQHIFTTHI